MHHAAKLESLQFIAAILPEIRRKTRNSSLIYSTLQQSKRKSAPTQLRLSRLRMF